MDYIADGFSSTLVSQVKRQSAGLKTVLGPENLVFQLDAVEGGPFHVSHDVQRARGSWQPGFAPVQRPTRAGLRLCRTLHITRS